MLKRLVVRPSVPDRAARTPVAGRRRAAPRDPGPRGRPAGRRAARRARPPPRGTRGRSRRTSATCWTWSPSGGNGPATWRCGERLTKADLSNRRTHEADHNAAKLEGLLAEFRRARGELVRQLERFPEDGVVFAALHPRLKVSMNVVDLAFFVAEHDNYHLAGSVNCSARGHERSREPANCPQQLPGPQRCLPDVRGLTQRARRRGIARGVSGGPDGARP